MTPTELQNLIQKLPKMSEAQLRDLYATVEEHEILKERETEIGRAHV